MFFFFIGHCTRVLMLFWLDLAASWISPVNWAELQKRNEVNNGSKQPERRRGKKSYSLQHDTCLMTFWLFRF